MKKYYFVNKFTVDCMPNMAFHFNNIIEVKEGATFEEIIDECHKTNIRVLYEKTGRKLQPYDLNYTIFSQVIL